MNYVGIDCAKATFEVVLPVGKQYQVIKLENTETGFYQLLTKVSAASHCVMEANPDAQPLSQVHRTYYCRLAAFLHQNQIAVSVVNPLVIKRFAQMRLIRAKTDKADSILIAHYAHLENPAQWAPTPQLLLEAAQEMTQT